MVVQETGLLSSLCIYDAPQPWFYIVWGMYQKWDILTTWCCQGQWSVKLGSPLSNIFYMLVSFYLPFSFDTIYLYNVLCHIVSVWLTEPIMYLDCHVTVWAPQPFISKTEVRTLLFTVYYESKTNYLLILFWLYSSLGIEYSLSSLKLSLFWLYLSLDIHCYL